MDVCRDDQLIWFDAGELDEFPLDLADAAPSDAELAALDRIRTEFGQQLVEAAEAAEAGRITERRYRRIAARPGRHRATAALRSEAPTDLVDRLANLILEGDDVAVGRIRPFQLADAWQVDRRDLLVTFLSSVRAGLLERN